jgi:hypothetical protein
LNGNIIAPRKSSNLKDKVDKKRKPIWSITGTVPNHHGIQERCKYWYSLIYFTDADVQSDYIISRK